MGQSSDEQPEDSALRQRLDRLSSSLDTHQPARPPPEPPSSKTGFDGMGMGFRVVAELVAGMVVGGGLGWLIDRWLGTKPILLIVFLLLGIAGGFWNVMRETILPRGHR